MKKPLFIMSSIVWGLCSLSNAGAQTLEVKNKTGTTVSYNLSSLRKISFGSTDMVVQKKDGSTGAFTLANLRYLSFKETVTHVPDENAAETTAMVMLYPNPCSNQLKIANIEGDYTAEVISLTGSALLRYTLSGESVIDVSTLPAGQYLLRVSSQQETKTTKFIKQ